MKAAEIQLTYSNPIKKKDRVKISNSYDVEELARTFYGIGEIEHREHFYCILVNNANEVLGFFHVGTGGLTGTVADPRIIFQAALLANACGIIMVHNHPSGNLKPSDADIRLTRNINDACKIMQIQLVDHIILSEETFFSFRDDGLI